MYSVWVYVKPHPTPPSPTLCFSVLVCVSTLYICVLLSVFVFLCNKHEHTHTHTTTNTRRTHTHTQTTDSTAERNEEQQPISEPPIKLVHVLNPGEREYLSPNLIGVQNIAMTFLPLSMNFINIIDAFREIVNGVRYEILLNAVDTKQKDADTICRLVILEKPWITTQWGDKHRELVNSNCSDIADNALDTDAGDLDPEQRAKSLNDKYVSNSIFNGGRRNELSDSEMAQLEAQILPSTQSKRQYSINSSSGNTRSGSTTSSTITSSSSSSSTTTTPQNTPQADPTNEPTTSISVDEPAATGEAGKLVEVEATPTTPAAELNDNEKRWLDDFLSVGAFNFEKTIEQQRTELKQQQQQEQEREHQQQQQVEEEPQQGREQQQEQLPVQEEEAQQAEVSSS